MVQYGQWQLVSGSTDGPGGGGDMDDSDISTAVAPRPRFPDQCTKICVYLVQFLRSPFWTTYGFGAIFRVFSHHPIVAPSDHRHSCRRRCPIAAPFDRRPIRLALFDRRRPCRPVRLPSFMPPRPIAASSVAAPFDHCPVRSPPPSDRHRLCHPVRSLPRPMAGQRHMYGLIGNITL